MEKYEAIKKMLRRVITCKQLREEPEAHNQAKRRKNNELDYEKKQMQTKKINRILNRYKLTSYIRSITSKGIGEGGENEKGQENKAKGRQEPVDQTTNKFPTGINREDGKKHA
ncbi:unnamed protein product [Dovyalis caffra]|uniref:Uncharacterized protein n=1 Tax=Dovyalis caffra TaxID=77055 RepID=A0AAV1RKG0_9ROSI|nr:unnamed protein product [Dovyalis caffra]